MYYENFENHSKTLTFLQKYYSDRNKKCGCNCCNGEKDDILMDSLWQFANSNIEINFFHDQLMNEYWNVSLNKIFIRQIVKLLLNLRSYFNVKIK